MVGHIAKGREKKKQTLDRLQDFMVNKSYRGLSGFSSAVNLNE